MKFEFEKFIDDIEKRKVENRNQQKVEEDIAEHDRLRRLRAANCQEKWQNRIVWER